MVGDEQDHYTSGEIGRICGIPARTARRYLQSGKIPAVQNPITGRWKVSRGKLIEFLKKHQLPTTALERPVRRLVLVIDDEEWIGSFVKSILEEPPAELAVEVFTDSHQACLRLGTITPDLVILDLRMPNVDGRQVLKVIRQHPATAKVPVLIISGYPEDYAKIGPSSHLGFLAKPFTDLELGTAVNMLLASPMHKL